MWWIIYNNLKILQGLVLFLFKNKVLKWKIVILPNVTKEILSVFKEKSEIEVFSTSEEQVSQLLSHIWSFKKKGDLKSIITTVNILGKQNCPKNTNF